MNQQNNTMPIYSIFWAKNSSILTEIITIILGVILLDIASQITIPWQPVPLTFQSATVLLIGMTMGAHRGLSIVSAYLLAGLYGLPVFAEMKAGLVVFMGPTGGYLIGFLPAVGLVGVLSQIGMARRTWTAFIAACAGAAIIFLFGILFLTKWVGGFHQAYLLGVKPFIGVELIKLILAAMLVPYCWKKYAK